MEWFLRLYVKGKCILEFCKIQTFTMKFCIFNEIQNAYLGSCVSGLH